MNDLNVDHEEAVTTTLTGLGLQPVVQHFLATSTANMPQQLAAILALLSALIFWRDVAATRLAAVVLLAVVCAALLYERRNKDNALRWWLPQYVRQDMHVQLPAAAEPAQRTVRVVVPLQMQPTTPQILGSFGLLQRNGWLAFWALFAILLMGLLTGVDALKYVALLPTGIILVLFLMGWFANRTAAQQTAQNPDTLVAIGVALATRLTQSPLSNTQVNLAFLENTTDPNADLNVDAQPNETADQSTERLWQQLQILDAQTSPTKDEQ